MKTFQIPFHLILRFQNKKRFEEHRKKFSFSNFSDRNNQRAHDLMIVKQIRRLLKETNEDTEQLQTDIRQQIKRLISFECYIEILELLFRCDFLNLSTMKLFIEEILVDVEKNAHHHNPQESTQIQDFCQNALNLLEIYTNIEQIRNEHSNMLSKNEKLFSKEDFQIELKLTDDETNLYYQFFQIEYQSRMETKKRKVHFNDNERIHFGQFHSMFHPIRQLDQQQYQFEIKSTINADDFSQLGLYLFSSWFWFPTDEHFAIYLESLHLTHDDLVLLALHSLLSMPIELPQSISIWTSLFHTFYSMSQNRNLISTTLVKTTNCLTSLLLALIIRLFDDEFDWNLLIRRLTGLIATKNLCLSIETSDIDQDEMLKQFNVQTIFIQHRHDYLIELITKKFVLNNIQPVWLLNSNEQSSPNLFAENLAICRQILPHTFDKTVLLIYSCWVAMSLWNKQLLSPTNLTISNLFIKSLDYYNHIQIEIVKQNLGTLLWHTYLRSRISTLTYLIEKIGKIPKDRLCYKELRLNEKDLMDFLDNLLRQFFNSYIQSIYNQLNEIPIFNIDELWQLNNSQLSFEPVSPFINLYTHSTFAEQQQDQQTTLLELVMEQKPANGHLVLHHEKLIYILNYLMFYRMKSIRPFSLFDSKGIHAFFVDLHTHPLVTDDVDSQVSNQRQLFFTRLLNTIFEQTTNFDEKLFDEILRLSTDMFVDHEYIRRHYIALLYAYNYDHLAINEENRIHDRQTLAFQLLTIAGLRLNYMIEGHIDSTTTKFSTKSLEIRGKLSSTLKTWLASLPTLVDYKIQSCSLEAIESMLTRIACYLPQTNLSQSNLAQEMIELVHLLKR